VHRSGSVKHEDPVHTTAVDLSGSWRTTSEDSKQNTNAAANPEKKSRKRFFAIANGRKDYYWKHRHPLTRQDFRGWNEDVPGCQTGLLKSP